MLCLPRHRRRLKRFGNLEPKVDTLPLDFGLLEIDRKTERPARSSRIVETLRGVFAGQAFHTFQFDHQHVFDERIGKARW